MRSLNELGAPDIPTSGGGDAHRRLELAKWLSDWHLVTFLGTCGLLSEVSNRAFGFSCFSLFRSLSNVLSGRLESVDSRRYCSEYGRSSRARPAVEDGELADSRHVCARECPYVVTSPDMYIATHVTCSRLLCPQHHLNVLHSQRRIVRQRVIYTRTSHPNCSMTLRRLPIVKVVRLLAYACVHTARTKTRTVETIATCADCHSRRLKRYHTRRLAFGSV